MAAIRSRISSIPTPITGDGAYADLICPAHYLGAGTASPHWTKPICDADGAADAIANRCCRRPRCRPFPEVLDLSVRLGLPGLTEADGSAKYPGNYPDYLVNPRAHAHRPLGQLARPMAAARARQQAVDRYIEMGAGVMNSRPSSAISNTPTKAVGNRSRNGFHRRGQASRSGFMSNPCKSLNWRPRAAAGGAAGA